MLLPFILDSTNLTPSLNAKPSMPSLHNLSQLERAEDVYDSANWRPLVFAHQCCNLPYSFLPLEKTLLSATSSELPLKCMHTSACGSCCFSWVFCEGNEPKFTGDFGENSKKLKRDVFSTGFSQFGDQMFICCRKHWKCFFLGSSVLICITNNYVVTFGLFHSI